MAGEKTSLVSTAASEETKKRKRKGKKAPLDPAEAMNAFMRE